MIKIRGIFAYPVFFSSLHKIGNNDNQLSIDSTKIKDYL